MKSMNIRNIPPDVAEALDEEKHRRGQSLNQTVIDLLRQGLGVSVPRLNGLERLAGTWSVAEFRQFTDSVAPFDEVDDDLWK